MRSGGGCQWPWHAWCCWCVLVVVAVRGGGSSAKQSAPSCAGAVGGAC